MDGGTALGSVVALAGYSSYLEAYRSLGPLVRAGVQFAGTLLAAMVVLGLVQSYGTRAVAKSRRSPVISMCIGIPSLLVVGGLASTGLVISDSSIGVFFGIPLVVLGATTLPAATAIGVVAIGRTVASRLGDDRLVVGLLVGVVCSGLAGLSVPATVAFAGLAATLGLGGSVRILFAGAGTARPDERTVPPANKI
ncbi:hypothetical protein [Natrinema salaciae]|nr:hypothetical protein [Natrinema salaciae]